LVRGAQARSSARYCWIASDSRNDARHINQEAL
jgi:hypothetical protein